jgi:hypothetical protein
MILGSLGKFGQVNFMGSGYNHAHTLPLGERKSHAESSETLLLFKKRLQDVLRAVRFSVS